MKAYLSEIFSSIQGEGRYVGERHLFVRFCGCHRSCLFCDTVVERTSAVQIEKVPGSGIFESVPNPLSVDQLVERVLALDAQRENHRIAITGGAPLLQADYLEALLPRLVKAGRRIYLEATGDLPQQLQQVVEWVDVVAMDIKLASVTKEPSTLSKHWNFLEIARSAKAEVLVKLVVSAETNEEELMQVAEGIARVGGAETQVVLQPMSRAAQTDAVPSGSQLLRWQGMLRPLLPQVRVIPQTHLMMKLL